MKTVINCTVIPLTLENDEKIVSNTHEVKNVKLATDLVFG